MNKTLGKITVGVGALALLGWMSGCELTSHEKVSPVVISAKQQPAALRDINARIAAYKAAVASGAQARASVELDGGNNPYESTGKDMQSAYAYADSFENYGEETVTALIGLSIYDQIDSQYKQATLDGPALVVPATRPDVQYTARLLEWFHKNNKTPFTHVFAESYQSMEDIVNSGVLSGAGAATLEALHHDLAGAVSDYALFIEICKSYEAGIATNSTDYSDLEREYLFRSIALAKYGKEAVENSPVLGEGAARPIIPNANACIRTSIAWGVLTTVGAVGVDLLLIGMWVHC
jgi:hypothetical protein